MRHYLHYSLIIFALVSCRSYDGPYSQRFQINQKIITALKNQGSDFSKLHVIEHHLECNTKYCFEHVSQAGKSAGFSVKFDGKKPNNDQIWVIDLVKPSKIDIKSIEEQCMIIESISGKFGAYYDGWGTEVEK